MSPAVAIPLIVFVALSLVFAVILRRAARLLAAIRRDDAFRTSVARLVEQLDRSLSEVIGRVDALRRHQVEAGEIATDLATASEAIVRYTDEARELQPPAGRLDPRPRLVAELERAGRAVDMVEHGCAIVVAGQGRAQELEAHTSIKRGYLNLIHARDAMRQVGGDVTVDLIPQQRSLFRRSDHTM